MVWILIIGEIIMFINYIIEWTQGNHLECVIFLCMIWILVGLNELCEIMKKQKKEAEKEKVQ